MAWKAGKARGLRSAIVEVVGESTGGQQSMPAGRCPAQEIATHLFLGLVDLLLSEVQQRPEIHGDPSRFSQISKKLFCLTASAETAQCCQIKI